MKRVLVGLMLGMAIAVGRCAAAAEDDPPAKMLTPGERKDALMRMIAKMPIESP
jgi:hypothetical protein